MYNSLLKGLIEKFRKQDMNAFTLIYDEFKRLIYLYCGRLGDDDAVQEMTLFLIELLYGIELSRFKSDESDGLKRYIAVALKNKYIAIAKENQHYKSCCGELFEEYAQNSLAPEQLLISEALECLTDKQRIIIVYKYIYCLSDCEISAITGISRQAVNRLKNRALHILKQFYFDKAENTYGK